MMNFEQIMGPMQLAVEESLCEVIKASGGKSDDGVVRQELNNLLSKIDFALHLAWDIGWEEAEQARMSVIEQQDEEKQHDNANAIA
jgi:hypothetical protein